MNQQIDWLDGIAQFRPEQARGNEESRCSVFFCGDWAPEAGHRRAIEADPISIYGDLLTEMKAADYLVVNLECVISDRFSNPIAKDGSTIHMPSSVLSALTRLPVHLACMANNHAYDLGCEGMVATQSLLAQAGIAYTGAGTTEAMAREPYVIQHRDLRLAILNVAEGEEARADAGRGGVAGLDLAKIEKQVQTLRAEVDVVIAIVHGGREYLPVPAPYVRSAYRAIADAGADLIVGHHPHVPQGIEFYHNVPIAYSLGNFVFSLDRAARLTHLGFGLSASFDRRGLTGLSIHPYEIMPDRLESLKGDARTSFLTELESLGRFIPDDEKLASIWSTFACIYLERYGLLEIADSVANLGAFGAMARALLQRSVGDSDASRWQRLASRVGLKALQLNERHTPRGRRTSSRGGDARQVLAASLLRNRFDTPAHRELFLSALGQLMDGKERPGPAWAVDLLNEWSVFDPG